MQKLFASTETEQLTAEQVHLAMQDASIDEMLDTSATLAEHKYRYQNKIWHD